MKSIIALACFLSFAAHATPEHDVKPPKPPKAIKSARAASTTGPIGITNTVGAPSAVFGGTSALGGAGGSVAGSGNAYVSSERSAPGAYAPNASAPQRSCRLIFGFGGSKESGGISAGLPLGNDQPCITGVGIDLLDVLSAKGVPVKQEDYVLLACKVEGMADTSPCKAMKPSPAVSAYRDPALN